MSETSVLVRGPASDEEIAAVVAALHRSADGGQIETGYARWRRQRLAALRSSRVLEAGRRYAPRR